MAKKQESAKKAAAAAAPIKKVAVKKVAAEGDGAPKKRRPTKKRVVPKSSLAPYVKRLCVSIKVPRVETDSLEVVDNGFYGLTDGISKQALTMLADHKTFTRHVAKTASIAYLRQCGASDKVIKAALAAGDAAVETLRGGI